MITLTERAADRVMQLLKANARAGGALRVQVKAGGCGESFRV